MCTHFGDKHLGIQTEGYFISLAVSHGKAINAHSRARLPCLQYHAVANLAESGQSYQTAVAGKHVPTHSRRSAAKSFAASYGTLGSTPLSGQQVQVYGHEVKKE